AQPRAQGRRDLLDRGERADILHPIAAVNGAVGQDPTPGRNDTGDRYRWLADRRASADATIERNYIAETDASDYAFPQLNSDRDKVAAMAGSQSHRAGSTSKATGRHHMKSLSIAALLLMASALTPVSAADMTHERALNVAKEPHNWL